MMYTCPKCGEWIDGNTCPNCGWQVGDPITLAELMSVRGDAELDIDQNEKAMTDGWASQAYATGDLQTSKRYGGQLVFVE